MSKAETMLFTSVTEHDMGGGLIEMSASGDRTQTALVAAAMDHWSRYTGRPELNNHTAAEQLEDLANRGEKATVVYSGQNMFGASMLKAIEGTMFVGARTGQPALRPKGKQKNGVVLKPDQVVDILPGYAAAMAVALANQVRERLPKLKPLTRERLLELPSQDSEVCSIAVFGTHPLWGATDAIWLLTAYWPDDDILDSEVLLIRPEHATSENGSVLGRELLSFPVGEIVGYQPISYTEANELCHVPFDEAYERIVGTANKAAC